MATSQRSPHLRGEDQGRLLRPGRRAQPKFHILAATWNVAASAPNAAPDLSDWLCADDVRVSVDLYVIGLQEAQPLSGVDAVRTDRDKSVKWESKLQKCVGADYESIVVKQLTGIVMIVFLHTRHRNAWSALEFSYAATGFMKQGNKGGIAARLVIYDRPICFVVAHLSASDENVGRRNEDFSEILRKAVFVPQGSRPHISDGQLGREEPTAALRKNFSDIKGVDFRNGSHHKIVASLASRAVNVIADLKEGGNSKALIDPHKVEILHHDLVVWLGDLNYRIDAAASTVERWVNEENWPALQAEDQLNKARRSVEYIRVFEEAKISFAPTYKVSKYRHGFARDENGTLKRTPSYTDRVLWYINSKPGGNRERDGPPLSVECLAYDSALIFSSDHRPVYALLAVDFDPGSPTRKVGPFRPSIERESFRDYKKQDIEFSRDVLDFGEVPVNLLAKKELIIRNLGCNEAHIGIRGWKNLPIWLKVCNLRAGEKVTIPPNGKVEMTFEVHLARDSRLKNTVIQGGLRYEAPVLILADPMLVKHTLQVKVGARNSCYAMRISDLIMYKTPVAHAEPHENVEDSSSSSSSSGNYDPADDLDRAPLPVPKEVWRLADELVKRAFLRKHHSVRMFLTPAAPRAWHEVLVRLDYDTDLIDMDDVALGTCLVELLRELPEPVLPREHFGSVLAAAQRRSLGLLHETFAKLAPSNFNVLYYVLSFLAEMSLAWLGPDQGRVLAVFAGTALLGRCTASSERIRDRVQIMAFVIEEYANGQFSPQTAFDLTGVDYDPDDFAQSRSRRWKAKGKRKMKKVFG